MNVTVATAPEIASGNSVAGWPLSPFCVSMVCLRSQFWSHHALDRPPNLPAQRRGRCRTHAHFPHLSIRSHAKPKDFRSGFGSGPVRPPAAGLVSPQNRPSAGGDGPPQAGRAGSAQLPQCDLYDRLLPSLDGPAAGRADLEIWRSDTLRPRPGDRPGEALVGEGLRIVLRFSRPCKPSALDL